MSDHPTDLDGILTKICEKLNILADEVQLLNDKKIILEQKLRFARDEFLILASKYPAEGQEISSTMVTLLSDPNSTIHPTNPDSLSPEEKQLKANIDSMIRDIKLAVQSIAVSETKGTNHCTSVKNTSETGCNPPNISPLSSIPQAEKELTLLENKSHLQCPFSNTAVPPPNEKYFNNNNNNQIPISIDPNTNSKQEGPKPYPPNDPISADIHTEKSPLSVSAGAKCPIRFLNQHSPEEVARYFETHKHEIPRSHAICVKRQQKNEDHVRSLDAKYGSLVSMIQGLGLKHKPLLPDKDDELDATYNNRVSNWAQNVSPGGIEPEAEEHNIHNDVDWESRFDRPIKEVRVGESPSRPWGISVPIVEPLLDNRDESPPAPLFTEHTAPRATKCTSRCTQFGEIKGDNPTQNLSIANHLSSQLSEPEETRPTPVRELPDLNFPIPRINNNPGKTASDPLPTKTQSQPTFLPTPQFPLPQGVKASQTVFTGPVFIGYPIEQAINIIKQHKV